MNAELKLEPLPFPEAPRENAIMYLESARLEIDGLVQRLKSGDADIQEGLSKSYLIMSNIRLARQVCEVQLVLAVGNKNRR